MVVHGERRCVHEWSCNPFRLCIESTWSLSSPSDHHTGPPNPAPLPILVGVTGRWLLVSCFPSCSFTLYSFSLSLCSPTPQFCLSLFLLLSVNQAITSPPSAACCFCDHTPTLYALSCPCSFSLIAVELRYYTTPLTT